MLKIIAMALLLLQLGACASQRVGPDGVHQKFGPYEQKVGPDGVEQSGPYCKQSVDKDSVEQGCGP